jgi:hypothetical protein
VLLGEGGGRLDRDQLETPGRDPSERVQPKELLRFLREGLLGSAGSV